VLTAEEAERAGLVNRVVPGSELAAAADEMAREAAKVPPVTARAVKESINHTLDLQGQAESWRHHFMVHQFVSATDTATSMARQRAGGGMAAVKAAQSGTDPGATR
jgi:enoyl-CoA hydratase